MKCPDCGEEHGDETKPTTDELMAEMLQELSNNLARMKAIILKSGDDANTVLTKAYFQFAVKPKSVVAAQTALMSAVLCGVVELPPATVDTTKSAEEQTVVE